MTGQVKANPTKLNTTDHLSGKTITAVTVDFAVHGTDFSSTEMGALGAVQIALNTLTETSIPLIITKLRTDGSNDGQVFDVVYEGEFSGHAATLQARLRLLTSVGAGPVNLGSATVVAATAASF